MLRGPKLPCRCCSRAAAAKAVARRGPPIDALKGNWASRERLEGRWPAAGLFHALASRSRQELTSPTTILTPPETTQRTLCILLLCLRYSILAGPSQAERGTSVFCASHKAGVNSVSRTPKALK